MWPAVVVMAVCAGLAASCDRAHEAPAVAPAATAPASPAGAAAPHGDHTPRHGGIVLMNGDLHFEVVLRRDGAHRLYFSDAMREELPAATASGVTVTVSQKARPPEVVALRIDDSGESWLGRGRQVDDPDASARVSFIASGKPYFIDVPVPR